MLDQVAGLGREAAFDGLEGGLEAADDLLDGGVDVLDPLGDLTAGASEPVLDLGPGLGQALHELLTADLGALDAEHAESDDDVGGVSDGLGDLLRNVLDFGHRMSFLFG